MKRLNSVLILVFMDIFGYYLNIVQIMLHFVSVAKVTTCKQQGQIWQ